MRRLLSAVATVVVVGASCTLSALPAGAAPAQAAGHVQTGAISGRVTDSAGRRLGNVLVELFNAPDGDHQVRTAANGTYAFAGLPSGSYEVCFGESGRPVTGGTSPTGYVHTCTGAVEVAAPRTARLDQALVTGAAVSGRVSDEGGRPVRGVALEIVPAGSLPTVPGGPVTAVDGTFRATGLAAGTYRICFHTENAAGGGSTTGYLPECFDNTPLPAVGDVLPGTDVPLVAGRERHGVNATLARGGAITGTVVNPDGTPRAGVHVRVQQQQGSVLSGEQATGRDGRYRLTGLRTGSYSVCFGHNPGTFPPADGLLNQCYRDIEFPRDNVPVTAGRVTTGIDAHLNAGGQISGRVTDLDGNPLGQVLVGIPGAPDGQAVRTADDGTYTVVFVHPGNTQLCFFGENGTGGTSLSGYQSECYNDQPVDGQHTPIPVTAGRTTTGIDAALAPRTVSSTTVTGTGITVTDTSVTVTDGGGTDGTVGGSADAAAGGDIGTTDAGNGAADGAAASGLTFDTSDTATSEGTFDTSDTATSEATFDADAAAAVTGTAGTGTAGTETATSDGTGGGFATFATTG
jgi:Carboxypeptidase regulatory-like domain